MFTSDTMRMIAYKARIIPGSCVQDFYIDIPIDKHVIHTLRFSEKYDRIKFEERRIYFFKSNKSFYFPTAPYFIKLLQLCIMDPVKYLQHKFIRSIHIERIRLKMKEADDIDESISIKCAEFILS